MFNQEYINIEWSRLFVGSQGLMRLNFKEFFPCTQANMNKLLKVLDLELRSNNYYSSNELVLMEYLLKRYRQFIKFEDQKTADKYKRNIRQLQAFMNKNYIMNIDLDRGIDLLLDPEAAAEYVDFMAHEFFDFKDFMWEVVIEHDN